MTFDRARANPFVLRLTAGATAVGLLAWLLLELLLHTHLYATALIVAGALFLVAYSLMKAVARADGVMADVLDSLAVGRTDSLLRPMRGFPALARAVEAASKRLHQESLQRQTERDALKALLDTAPTALLVLHTDARVELVNRMAFALAGRDVDRLADIDALGHQAITTISELPPGGRAIIAMADERKMFVSASQFLHPDGRRSRLIALQNIAGELDVVEQKAWRDLIRVLAHEMMNSLTPIASLSETLSRRPEADQESAEALQVIARRSANLLGFVDRYRAVAELPEPVLRPVRLSALAHDIGQLVRGGPAGERVSFTSAIEPADLMLMADPQLLEQAIINLVKNALDATAEAQAPVICLSCVGAEERIVIAVADNGEGVDPEKVEAIFVPFFSSRSGGSGIGLSLARQIVLAHGGQLTVRANAPRGSIFEMNLPGRPAA
jgi:two-component system nitrogen regulation sensor histidine kinase NtrY